ncbi:ComF family protein [Streptomyces sp. NPDC057696]|uniref:ComF family protein n=1 Tax=Streptomyces sp. NPDC057696 TaxID=3346218 RepID=UPI003683EC93
MRGQAGARAQAGDRIQGSARTPAGDRIQGSARTPAGDRIQGSAPTPGDRTHGNARTQASVRVPVSMRSPAGMRTPASAPTQPAVRIQRPTQPPTPLLLVPVPSARKAVRARGHDPARRIAYAAAAELRRAGVPARVLAALRQRRAVADQAGLDSRRRLANLAGALEVSQGARALLASGGRIVLVDDVMTTGASLAEAARAIRAAAVRTAEDESDGFPPGWVETARELPPRNSISAAVVASSPGSFEINRN